LRKKKRGQIRRGKALLIKRGRTPQKAVRKKGEKTEKFFYLKENVKLQ